MRAIRGAVQVQENTAAAISAAVRELCRTLCAANHLGPHDLISAIFTLTPDLDADFPARAAREEGWSTVPLMCAQEIAVRGSMPRVCRVLVHAHGDEPAQHVYLGATRSLRPDLVASQESP